MSVAIANPVSPSIVASRPPVANRHVTPTRPIPTPSTPVRFKWTCDQFHQLGDLGAFEGVRPMLIDGDIWEQGEMNPPHATALVKANRVFIRSFDDRWHLRSQAPLQLGQNLDPQPDFALIAGSENDLKGHPTTAVLVLEISDKSLRFDQVEKASLYAAAKIPEYWVLDLNGRQLHVYRDPIADSTAVYGGHYQSQVTHAETDRVSPLADPQISIVISELLN